MLRFFACFDELVAHYAGCFFDVQREVCHFVVFAGLVIAVVFYGAIYKMEDQQVLMDRPDILQDSTGCREDGEE